MAKTPGMPGGHKKPSNLDLQDMRRRMNQGPRISQAQTTADDGVARGIAAQQRADEAHDRNTNTALNSAHTAAEGAQSAAEGAQSTATKAHSRSTNAAIDSAHTTATSANTNANARLSRSDGGTVTGITRFDNLLEEITCVNTTIGPTTTVGFDTRKVVKHVGLAHVSDGTEGWIPLPTVGSTPLYVSRNSHNHTYNFAVRNTRTIEEIIHARLWTEAY